jgi:hypothetical protein
MDRIEIETIRGDTQNAGPSGHETGVLVSRPWRLDFETIKY